MRRREVFLERPPEEEEDEEEEEEGVGAEIGTGYA
jgi:hypothetical protein